MNAILLFALLGSITDPVPAPAWLRREPVPPPMNLTVVEVEHSGRPTVKPITVAHGRTYGLGDSCPMCNGQHLRNLHGQTTAELDVIGYRAWPVYHARLHDAMGTAQQSGCPGGMCNPPRTVRSLLRRWR